MTRLILCFGGGILAMTQVTLAQCYTPKAARNAVRAIALVSDRSMITDIVGKVRKHIGNQSSYQIWANYRHHNYADRYEVIIEENTCRILSLRLTGTDMPVKKAE